mgnify:CR=1 FL=1
MEEMKLPIDQQQVSNSLLSQAAELMMKVAQREAVIMSLQQKIQELEQELEQLRKEHIERLNKEAEA